MLVVSVLDSKHVVMLISHNSGSAYFNNKKTHSNVILAVCNAKYEFIMADIGDSGRQSDGSVYINIKLGFAFKNNTLNLPDPDVVGSNPENILSTVFIADDAFGLKCHMTKSYPYQNILLDERIFNYSSLRAKRIKENAFGLAASRFRIFRRSTIAITEKVILITKSIVALHNLLMKKHPS